MRAVCGGLVFTSPTELEEALDAELHRKGRGPWAPPSGSSPTSMPSPIEAVTGSALGPHWVIVDDNVGTPEQWEGVTGQKGMAGITVLRLATRPAPVSASPTRTSASSYARAGCATAAPSTPSPTCLPRAPPTGMPAPSRAGRR